MTSFDVRRLNINMWLILSAMWDKFTLFSAFNFSMARSARASRNGVKDGMHTKCSLKTRNNFNYT